MRTTVAHDDDGGDDVASPFPAEEDAEGAACPPQDSERDVLLRRTNF